MSVLRCPHCKKKLLQLPMRGRSNHVCAWGHGRAAPAAFVRHWLAHSEVERLDAALRTLAPGTRPCARCGQKMGRLRFAGPELDYCRACYLMWFDAGELEQLPHRDEKDIEQEDEQSNLGIAVEPGLRFDALTNPVQNLRGEKPGLPVVTLILAACCTIAYNLDPHHRQFVFDSTDPWRGFGIPGLLSVFGHGDRWHLASNSLFLVYLGTLLESTLGWATLLKVFAASALGGLLFVFWSQDPPTLGASGAIAGLIACLLITQPQAVFVVQDTEFYPSYFGRSLMTATYRIPLFLVGLAWFALEILGFWNQRLQATDNISYASHLGGFLAGAAFCFVTDLKVLTPPAPKVKEAIVRKLKVAPLRKKP